MTQVETAPMTDADLLDALRDCYDQVLKRNVVDLRMVRSAHVSLDEEAPGANIRGVAARYRADIRLVANSSDESANAQLVALIENRLKGMSSISEVRVELLPPVFPILQQQAR